MTTLADLKAQHPNRCWECGHYDKSLCEEYGNVGDEKFFATLLSLIQHHEAELAKARETIAELERVVCTGCWDDARRLATEQQAHAATKEELRKAAEALDMAIHKPWLWGKAQEAVYQTLFARQSARGQQESEAKKEDAHD